MSTIDELINNDDFIQSGSFKVRRTHWDEGYYFMPYYLASYWYGLDSEGDSCDYKHDANDFEIYKERKPKVKHWLWTYLGIVKFGSSNPGGSAIDAEWKKIPGSEVEI